MPRGPWQQCLPLAHSRSAGRTSPQTDVMMEGGSGRNGSCAQRGITEIPALGPEGGVGVSWGVRMVVT